MVANFLKWFQRGYTDVVGVDVGGTATKAVRLKRTKDGVFHLLAADFLPRAVLPDGAEGAAVPVAPLQLPKPLRARYVALALSSPATVIKLLTFPAHSDKSKDSQVSDLLGLGNAAEYRMAYESVAESRSESKVLAVAMPDRIAHAACGFFPAGKPAPCSLEFSGLCSLTAYTRGPGKENRDQCVAVMDFGAYITTVAFFNKDALCLIRKFDFGASGILKRLEENLGVETDVAVGILTDGSFDITHVVHQAMESFLQQVAISVDFVERRENSRVSKLFVCGGVSGMRSWGQEIQKKLGLEPVYWDPFKGLPAKPGALPARLKGQEPRFSAAVGAALAVIGER